MTVPKVNTIHRGGSRLYVHPETAEKQPGVTSVLGMLGKPFLAPWSAKLVAEFAVANLGEIVGLTMREPAAAIELMKGAPRRYTANAADRGTQAHDIFERMAKGETLGRLHPEMQPYAKAFGEFLDEFRPRFRYLEATIWSETGGWAGSFDVMADFDADVLGLDPAEGPQLLVGDWKTTKSVYEEVALQLSAYAAGDYIVEADGERIELPKVDGGFVFHVAHDGTWSMIPVRCDEAVLEFFLALRKVYTWEKEYKSGVLGRPLNKGAVPKRRPVPRKKA